MVKQNILAGKIFASRNENCCIAIRALIKVVTEVLNPS